MGDYVTIPEVKEQLADLGSEYDPFLAKLISRASRDVDRLTRQFFDLQSAVTRLFDGSGSRTLFLPWNWPLVAITTLQVAAGGTGGSMTVVPSSDYFLEPADRSSNDPARWLELTDRPTAGVGIFTSGKRTVSIAGDWGRSAVPDEIKEVCLELVIRGWRNRGSGDSEDMGLQGALQGMDVGNVPRGLSPRSLAILREHGYQQPLMA